MTRAKFVCANCGKGIPKKTDTIYAPRLHAQMAPVLGWNYTGNKIVVSRRYYIMPDSQERRLMCVSVWDGESYSPEYGYFCTIGCAARFGKKACEVGFKREG